MPSPQFPQRRERLSGRRDELSRILQSGISWPHWLVFHNNNNGITAERGVGGFDGEIVDIWRAGLTSHILQERFPEDAVSLNCVPHAVQIRRSRSVAMAWLAVRWIGEVSAVVGSGFRGCLLDWERWGRTT